MMGLPLSLRLRRALLVALLLGLWAPFKIVWEQQIAHEQDSLRYKGVAMTRQLRDELGQGLTIGMLSGMRSVVADIVFAVYETQAWENEQWFQDGQLRQSFHGAPAAAAPPSGSWAAGNWPGTPRWHKRMHDPKQPDVMRRIKASRFWIDKGLDVYKRGIENNPSSWGLWANTGDLYQQRLKDYPNAMAIYYQRASELPRRAGLPGTRARRNVRRASRQ